MLTEEDKIFLKDIKELGNSAGILLPRWSLGMKAKVVIYENNFECNICDKTLPEFEESETKKICKKCLKIKKDVENDICLFCSKDLEKGNIGVLCQKCANKFKGHVREIPKEITPYLFFDSRDEIKDYFKLKEDNTKK